MRTRIWHSDWKPRWLIRCVSAALLSFMDKQVSFCWNALDINAECKRVNSPAQLPRRAKDARDQIARSGRSGIIAIDCSVLARPTGTLLETDSPVRAENQVSQWLEDNVVPQLQPSLSPNILGLVLFARIPAMTATGLLDANEQPYRRRDCISSILAVGNRSLPDQTMLREIARKLRMQARATS